MKPDDLLARLYDIRGLNGIDWWPLAPGWWALIALASIAAGAVYWRRQAYYRSWKGEAWLALLALEARLTAGNAQEIAAALSILLRRVAMQCFSRAECAGLEGHNWLRWLSAKDPGRFDWSGRGAVLIEAPYAPPGRAVSPQALKTLITAAKHWVK
jgi:hypothetical protein